MMANEPHHPGDAELPLRTSVDLDPHTLASLDRLVDHLVRPGTPAEDRQRCRRWLLRHLLQEATFAAEDAADRGTLHDPRFGFALVSGGARHPTRTQQLRDLQGLLARLLRDEEK